MNITARLIACGSLPLALIAAPARAEPPKLPVPAVDQSAVAQRGYFYVGGKYVGEPGKEIMQGQIYVEVLAPKDVRRPYPLVLIHGAAQTATNWMGTPDGRKGWAEYFVEQGYVVYMIDQPMRGRSAWHPGDGATRMFTAKQEQFQFTAIETDGNWPQAKKHTQWPGDGANKGKMGDPTFDAFYATQVETVISPEETQRRNQDAGAALLDKIGPAIVLTHSQSGPYGWLIADARPQLVKAVVAIEPAGPPFEATIIGTGKTRPWGPTDIAIAYDPPVKDPSEIAVEREPVEAADLFAAPARQPEEHPGGGDGGGSLLSPGLRPLHRQVPQPGRHEDRVHPPAGQGHPRQRPHGDDREEQSGDRQADRRLDGGEREEIKLRAHFRSSTRPQARSVA
jgi:pimeloyl-ACP methyl ester carboxylesterase